MNFIIYYAKRKSFDNTGMSYVGMDMPLSIVTYWSIPSAVVTKHVCARTVTIHIQEPPQDPSHLFQH